MKHTAISFLIITLAALAACSDPVAPAVPTPAASEALAPARKATFTPLPTAAPPSPTAGPRRGGELRTALAREAVSFHPYFANDATSALYQANVYASGLWRRDPQTLEFVPNMAETWTVSPDGRKVTVQLRRDLKWSDGARLTAHDFQWTFEQAVNPANKLPPPEEIMELIAYVAPGDYTLEITLRDPGCSALTLADGIVPLPRHVWEKYSWSDPAANPEIMHPTVVSGPFKLKAWNRDASASFVRNDSFFRGAPLLDAVTYRIVADANERYRMLQAGEVDAAPVEAAHYQDARRAGKLKSDEWEPAAATLDYVGLNVRRPLLQDAQLRRALAYAMPRQHIADQVFLGLAKPLNSLYPPSSRVHNSDLARYDYDLDKARAALTQAGYKWNAKNQLLGKDNRPAHLSVIYNENNEAYANIAQMLVTDLGKLGISVDAKGMEFGALLDNLTKPPYEYDLYILGWHTPVDPFLLFQLWNEKSTPDLNPGGYVNEELGKLYRQANLPPCTEATQKSTYHKIQAILANDSPFLWLTYRMSYALLNPRVLPNPPSPLGISYLPEQWSLRAP